MKKLTIPVMVGRVCPGFYDGVLMIFTFFLLVLAFSANGVSAQEPRSADELVVGQRIPDNLWDVPFRSLKVSGSAFDDGGGGFESSVFRLRELKGRLFILDFWATWCGGCIAGFPKAKGLQERFGDKLSFVLVNNEDPVKAERLLSRRFAENGEVFRYVNSDTLLNRLFFKRLIPFYVWIDGKGKVVAATGPDEVTEKNISLVLGGDASALRNVLDIDRKLPLFSSPTLPVKDLMKFSLLTRGKVSGLPTGMEWRKDPSGKLNSGRVISNLPFWFIYQKLFMDYSFRRKIPFDPERLRYEGKNFSLLRDTVFNYEFSVSGALIPSLDSLMLADLNTFAPFRISFEKRKVSCVSMDLMDSLKLPLAKGGLAKVKYHVGATGSSGRLVVENVRTSVLILLIKEYGRIPGPVRDRTASGRLVSLSLELPCSLGVLNRQLGDFGLHVVGSEEELDYAIVRDQPDNQIL